MDDNFEKWKRNLEYREKHGGMTAATRRTKLSKFKHWPTYLKENASVDYNSLSNNDINDFKEYLIIDKGLQKESANGTIFACNDFFSWMIGRGKLKENLFKKAYFKIKLKTRHQKANSRSLSYDEAKGAIENTGPIMNKAAFALMAGCGLRIGEVLAVQYEDIAYNEEQGLWTVKIRDQEDTEGLKGPKGGIGRPTFFIDGHFERLFLQGLKHHKKLKKKEKKPRNYSKVFPFNMSISALKKYCWELSKRVGYRVTCHGFRYAYSGTYIEREGTAEGLQMTLGHSESTTKDLYTRFAKMNLPRSVYRVRNFDPERYNGKQ